MTTTTTPAQLDVPLVGTAAAAAAERLPTASPLTPADPLPGTTEGVTSFAGAVLADVVGHVQGRLGVLIADDLVRALAESPVAGLTLAAAVQPALDAAASSLGASAGEGVEVDPTTLVTQLGADFTVVPLIGSGSAAAFVISDQLVTSTAPAVPGFVVDATGADVAPVVTSAPAYAAPVRRGLDLLHGVDMELTVELGRTRMTVRDLLVLAPGDVIELDRAAGAPADLLVNGRLIARGEVVVVDENFGLRITEILDSQAG